jgi:predicted RNA-binding Zn-ribbon protein involved in translation (DUF1610 family)
MLKAPWMGRHELDEFAPVERAEAAPPEPCLVCGYNLRGLPAHHACPECGTHVGLRAWRTEGGRVVWQRAFAVMLIASLPPLLLGTLSVISEASSWWTVAACIVVVGVLAATACAILQRLSRPPAQHDVELILSDHGLTERPRRGESIHVPWTSFGTAHTGRDLGGLRLLTLCRRRRGWLPAPAVSYIVDGDQIDPDALREQIERLMADSLV